MLLDGALAQYQLVGNLAIRFAPRSRNSPGFDLGYANGIGPTTALGLTPGLGGGSGAFFAAVTFRR